MPIALMKRAIALYSSPYVSKETNAHNRRAWLKSIQHLGPRWVLRGGDVRWGHSNDRS